MHPNSPNLLWRMSESRKGGLSKGPSSCIMRKALRSYVPHTKYKTPLNPKIHPEIHPKSPSKTEIQKKYEKYTKLGDFRIFSVFRFWRGIWGVFRGVFWGSEGFCILYGARMIASKADFSTEKWIAQCSGHSPPSPPWKVSPEPTRAQ